MALNPDAGAENGISTAGRRDRLTSMAIAAAALLFTWLAVEIPAIVGWIDYRYIIGFAEHQGGARPQPYPTYTTVRGEAPGDLVQHYGLPNTETRKTAFRADRYGFRNESDPEHAAVIVLGDSFVENSMIPDARLFTTLLGRQLGVAVANLGRSGWGPYDELETLRHIGLTLQPRVVLWTFYEGNDLADTLVYNGNEIGWSDRLFLTSAQVRLAAAAERALFGETRRNYSWHEGDPPFGSCRPPCSVPPCQRIYFGNLTGPLSLFEEVALRKVFDLVAEADTEARSHGSTLVVVYAPVTLRVYHDLCEFDEDSSARQSTLNDLPTRMETWARSKGIGFVDLTPALTAAAAKGNLVYFPDDTHWTELGSAVVANALASAPAIVRASATAH